MASVVRTEVSEVVEHRMASAPEARWHGDNYQARVFWENALALLSDDSGVSAVTFEANGPKAFDDVVVHYDPPRARSSALRISADYHQVKWHVTAGGRFGYADLIDPTFIGASSTSLLQRLRTARAKAGPSASFTFITTDRVRDDDPLGDILFQNDRTLLPEKLFDGTKTDRSAMGEVRALWREHLGLASDEELRYALEGFRIIDGHRSLEEMRRDIEWRAGLAGVVVDAGASEFRFDELARQLKIRGLNGLNRESIRTLFREERLFIVPAPSASRRPRVAMRSFLGPASDIATALPVNTLLLTDLFRQRYLREGFAWSDVEAVVRPFLLDAVKRAPQMELILDAHCSIAFLAGQVLHLKSGADIHLLQKGRVGGRIWAAGDGTDVNASLFAASDIQLGSGDEIAIGISAAQDVRPHVEAYVSASLGAVGRGVMFAPPIGPGQQTVRGGGHAAALAEQVVQHVRRMRGASPATRAHIFAACPNSLMFFLGQQQQAIGPCTVYEFDFDQHGNRTYQPAFSFN